MAKTNESEPKQLDEATNSKLISHLDGIVEHFKGLVNTGEASYGVSNSEGEDELFVEQVTGGLIIRHQVDGILYNMKIEYGPPSRD